MRNHTTPRRPPPSRLDPLQREQLRQLIQWRDLIALEDERPARELASRDTLRRLVREAPSTAEQLAASELLDDDVPKRFRRIALDVLRGVAAEASPPKGQSSGRRRTPRS